MSEPLPRPPRPLPIGGFLGMELPAAIGAASLRARWKLPGPQSAFATARSAFKGLLDALPSGAVFLPAYLCPEMSAVVPLARRRFYPIDESLSPQVSFLAARVAPGDIVLGVDYFGRPPGADFLAYVAQHPQVHFVEDCAQALATGCEAWGDWQLYSPRKLVGVPDGGVLVARSGRAAATPLADSVPGDCAAAVDLARAQWMRHEDADEEQNDRWYPLHRAKEDAMGVSATRISRLAWELLDRLDLDAIAAARRRNYAVLAGLLADVALLDALPAGCVPLGFPVRVAAVRRDTIRGRLFDARIYPAVHWEHLLAPAHEFAAEHALAAGALTLPCDQRYAAEQMQRLATAFRAASA